MDQRLIFGLGVSVSFGFARWMFPVVPKWFAAAGMACGAGLMLWSLMPFIRPGPAALALASIAGLAAATAWQLQAQPLITVGIGQANAERTETNSLRNSAETVPAIAIGNDIEETKAEKTGLGPNGLKGEPMSRDDHNTVIGADINHTGVGTGVEIQSHGTTDKPSIGAEVSVVGKPGQNVIGMRVTQNGPGTGLKIVQSGPGTGLKITVGAPPNDMTQKNQ